MGDRAGGGARTEVTFDYAWLFRAADDTLAPQCDAQWTTNLTAHDCTGLVYTAQGRIDPNDCTWRCARRTVSGLRMRRTQRKRNGYFPPSLPRRRRGGACRPALTPARARARARARGARQA